MSHQGFDITFKEFKEQFYSRIGDGNCFDVLDINTLKVVLDGLKVQYSKRGKISPYLNKSIFLLFIYYFFKILIDLKKRKNFKLKKLKLLKNKYLTAFSDNYYQEDNKKYSIYYENLYRHYGRENFCYIKKSSKDSLTADIELKDLIFSFNIFQKYNFSLLIALKKNLNVLRNSKQWNDDELANISIAYFLFINEYFKFDFLLKKMNFKFAFMDGHYHEEAFILACKKNNVKVIELQHGLISKEDIFYVLPKQVNKCISKALFADYIFVYGNYWKEVLLNGAEYSDKQINIIGDYQFEGEKEINPEKNGLKKILITTQYSIESYYISYIKSLSYNLDKNWEIIVKIHPVESKEIYSELAQLENVKVTSDNLNKLIDLSEFTISIFSTTLFDSIRRGKPSFALNIDFFKDYVDDIVSTNIIYLLQLNENPIDKFKALDWDKNKVQSNRFYEKFNPSIKLDDILFSKFN